MVKLLVLSHQESKAQKYLTNSDAKRKSSKYSHLGSWNQRVHFCLIMDTSNESVFKIVYLFSVDQLIAYLFQFDSRVCDA